MGAFGNPWKDIDETRPGTPYVVDSTGWGWALIFILASIPCLFVAGIIMNLSEAFCQHPFLFSALYLCISLFLGVVFYHRRYIRHRVLGIIATVFTLLPLWIAAFFYTIPIVVLDPSFSAFFNWMVVTALIVGIIYFIFAICRLLENGLIHLVVASIFLLLSIFFIRGLIASGDDILSWDAICGVYALT